MMNFERTKVYLTGTGFPAPISEEVRQNEKAWQEARKTYIYSHFNSFKNRVMHMLVSHASNASMFGRWEVYRVCRQALRLFDDFEREIKREKGKKIRSGIRSAISWAVRLGYEDWRAVLPPGFRPFVKLTVPSMMFIVDPDKTGPAGSRLWTIRTIRTTLRQRSSKKCSIFRRYGMRTSENVRLASGASRAIHTGSRHCRQT